MGKRLKIMLLSISLRTYSHIVIHNNWIPLKYTKAKPTISLSAGGIYYQKDVGIFLLVEGVLKTKIKDNENLVVFLIWELLISPNFILF
ncbi:hypothetical protein [Enterococcus sp. CWB-B31]|uniref:hypothetical protein n=1 Tax=Enterococcus sp. CWB-B31 TaxID=2885159 RepID=UPI001E446C32|nr:hypothetical protein [Enterococcus sp. CWB-B31]MCB5954203.1 hypothetical protein [Enterococcus sp. CWB-B31]